MGKMKTSFVGGVDEQPVKPSYDKAAKEAKRKERESGHEHHAPKTEEASMEVAQEATVETAEKQKKVRSKKYKAVYAKIDKSKAYKIDDAIDLVKETSYSSFDGTMELHMVIKKESFSTNVTLPHASGKSKVVEFANEQTLEKLKAGKIDFDVLLATADMMPKLVAFARVLGPRGLMPNPKNGTIVKSQKDADSFSTAQTTIKTEKKAPVIHTVVGKVSLTKQELLENLDVIFNAVNRRQIVKAYLKSTMSPSVRIQVL